MKPIQLKDFISHADAEVLAFNGLDNFEALWALQAPWFEKPNRRRGGWSGVVRMELPTSAGIKQGYFLKRQENHTSPTLLHPRQGIPTFRREFRNLVLFRDAQIPSMEPVYYAERHHQGKWRAILLTRELVGYQALDGAEYNDLSKSHGRPSVVTRSQRQRIYKAVAKVLRQMHRHRIQHNCFYSHHILIKEDKGSLEVRIIDLEKAKWRPFRILAVKRDLMTLSRRLPALGVKEKLRFFQYYRNESKLGFVSRKIWAVIKAEIARKGEKNIALDDEASGKTKSLS